MKTAILWLAVGLLVGYGASVAGTQAQAGPDVGVQPVRLINRDEMRISRVDLEAGAVRAVHAHTDVLYHVWIPLTENLRLTTGGSTVDVKPWQAFFFQKGTPHGFANPGAMPGAVLEIFVKDVQAPVQQ